MDADMGAKLVVDTGAATHDDDGKRAAHIKYQTRNKVVIEPVDYDTATIGSERYSPASILCKIYDRRAFCDVTIFGASSENNPNGIRAHRVILADASPHLLELFTGNHTDSNEPMYKFENVTHESLRDLIQFIYTDKLEMTGIKQVQDLLAAAKYWAMSDVVEACETYLLRSEHLNVETFLPMWRYARRYSCLRLMQATAFCIACNLADVMQRIEFLNLTSAELFKLLLSEAVIAANADQRCLAAMAWLNNDPSSRTVHASDILNMVPIDQLSNDAISKLCGNDMICAAVPDVVNQLTNNIPAKKVEPELPVCASAKLTGYPHGSWFVLGGGCSKNFLMYDPLRRVWETRSPLPWERMDAAACIFNDRLVLMGGFKDNELSAAVDEYTFSTSSWTSYEEKLSRARRNLAACSSRDTVLVFGGKECYHWECDMSLSPYGSTCCLPLVERYDGSNVTCVAEMSSGRTCTAVTFSDTNNAVFLTGGCDDHYIKNSIMKYSVSANEWVDVGQLAESRYGLATVLSGDDLYIAGGLVSRGEKLVPTTAVEIFNICTGVTTRMRTKLTESRVRCGAAALDPNVICIVGGSGFNGLGLPSVEVMDKREGTWSTGIIVPDMPEHDDGSRRGFAFACV